jgi:hypothetical protein
MRLHPENTDCPQCKGNGVCQCTMVSETRNARDAADADGSRRRWADEQLQGDCRSGKDTRDRSLMASVAARRDRGGRGAGREDNAGKDTLHPDRYDAGE